MFAFLPSRLKIFVTGFLMAVNLLLWTSLMVPVVIVKLVLPLPASRRWCSRILASLAEFWIDGNEWIWRLLLQIEWEVHDVSGKPFEPRLDKSYLVIANHQSWVDILVLQHTFHRQIPFFRFFLKKSLLYVPVLGAAWWALDYPFMSRHSKEFLRKHPERRNDDFLATRKACEKFKTQPVSILNFVEGTRFSPLKRDQQGSNYKNLLTPKAGGISFVLQTMGEQFEKILDVTIFYPQGSVTFGELLAGKLSRVVVKIRALDVPKGLLAGATKGSASGAAAESAAAAVEDVRQKPAEWMRELWQEKDLLLDQMKLSPGKIPS